MKLIRSLAALALALSLLLSCASALAANRPELPELDPDQFPQIQPIDISDRAAARAQMEAYCRALLTAPPFSLTLSDSPADICWDEGDDLGEAVYGVTLYTAENGDMAEVWLRADGTVRLVHSYIDSEMDEDFAVTYSEEQVRAHYGDVWMDQLNEAMIALSLGIDPDHGQKINEMRVSFGTEKGYETMALTLYSLLTEGNDNPLFIVKLYPQVQVVFYGNGRG